MARTTIRGEDLEQVLYEALANILESGDGVEVRVSMPADVTLSDVAVRLDAEITRAGVSDTSNQEEMTTAEIVEDATTSDDADDAGDAPDDAHGDADDDTAEAPVAGREVVESNQSSESTKEASSNDRGADDDESPAFDLAELEDEADAAADFIEGVLDAMDLPGDLRIKIDEVAGEAEVELLEVNTGALIGRRGQTLEALQELLRCSMQREFERRSRVKVDVEGYRARRLEKLIERAEEAIDDVLADGDPVRLEPMDVFERKAIHRLVGEHDGVVSRSQGREPGRRVVVEPA